MRIWQSALWPWLAAAGVLGSGYCLWMLAGAGREAVGWGAVLLLAGAPVYWMRTPGASSAR